MEYHDIDMHTIVVDGEDGTFEPMNVVGAAAAGKPVKTKKKPGEFDLCDAYSVCHRRPAHPGKRSGDSLDSRSSSATHMMSAVDLFKAGCEEAVAVAADIDIDVAPGELAESGLEFMGADTELVGVLTEILKAEAAESPPVEADAAEEDEGDLIVEVDAPAGDPGDPGIVVAEPRPWYSTQTEIVGWGGWRWVGVWLAVCGLALAIVGWGGLRFAVCGGGWAGWLGTMILWSKEEQESTRRIPIGRSAGCSKSTRAL